MKNAGLIWKYWIKKTMELNSVFYGVVLLVLSCSLSEARSLGSKVRDSDLSFREILC